MAKNSKSFLSRLVLLTQPFASKKAAIRLGRLDKLIDEIVRKNSLLATKLQEQIDQLDVENFPTTTVAPKYRWERLIKELDELSSRLQHFKQCLHKKQVRKALYMFSFDLWPMALKISCKHQTETGVAGYWIDDMNALYMHCEKYAEDLERAVDANKHDKAVIARFQAENTVRLVDVNRADDEDQIYDSNNEKRAS